MVGCRRAIRPTQSNPTLHLPRLRGTLDVFLAIWKDKAMPSARIIALICTFADLGGGGGLAGDLAFNAPGNILIADQFNNRVVEVAPSGEIVWQFGLGPNDVTSSSPVGVNDALRVGSNTLVTSTGAPPGSEPMCPAGCADDRVLLIDAHGAIIWQYGRFGVAGSGPDELNMPVQASWTPMHTVLIADQANQRIIEVSHDKKILWQYGVTGVAGSGPNHLNAPNSAELLDNGDILIADQSNNRAIEVSRSHKIIKTFTAGGTASAVAFASRLLNGDSLLTDSNNGRIVEVDAQDAVVWSYVIGSGGDGNSSPLPSRALRLKNGETLISDQFNHRVIVVDQAGRIVHQLGTLNLAGYDPNSVQNSLNAPCDAKKIGDYTGLTWSDSLHTVPGP
jgi:hypothetical protein